MNEDLEDAILKQNVPGKWSRHEGSKEKNIRVEDDDEIEVDDDDDDDNDDNFNQTNIFNVNNTTNTTNCHDRKGFQTGVKVIFLCI
jgi:hypothetical protein